MYKILEDEDIAYWRGKVNGQEIEVSFDDAVEFVLEQIGVAITEETDLTDEFLNNTVEWFFSGDWQEITKDRVREFEEMRDYGEDKGYWED